MDARRTLRFVALGDSTTVGIGDPVAGGGWRGWATLLAERLAGRHQLDYANLAVTGATAQSLRAIQLDVAVRMRPHLASLVVGVNDTMRSTWDAVRFHDHGEVFGLPRLLRRPLWRRIEVVNEAYDAAHQAHGGLRLDLTADPAVYHRQFWSVDRLHPGERGAPPPGP